MTSRFGTKVELLAPAGSFEKLEIAIHYGADAVYAGGKDFSLRNFSGNFSTQELERAAALCRENKVKFYVALNIYARNHELPALGDALDTLGAISPDAVIIADPGIVWEARRRIGHIPIHLSTQANTTNTASAHFWAEAGVTRINAARELTLSEIREISTGTNLEIEAFVHGAMCISHSGRCLISSYMTGRSANQGRCAHPCRWPYAVLEETRPNQYFPITEDKRGTYLFSAGDLCMIAHLPRLVEAGVAALKIEGRIKGINYLAAVVKTYREAIDRYYADPKTYQVAPEWMRELENISHRPYGTGFYFGQPQPLPDAAAAPAPPVQRLVGKVLSRIADGRVTVHVRNKVFVGEAVEILTPTGAPKSGTLRSLMDERGRRLPFAQPNAVAAMEIDVPCNRHDLIRRPGPPDARSDRIEHCP